MAAQPEMWNGVGNMARQARMAWLDLAAGGVPALSDATARVMAALQVELAGHSATAIERLLVDRVLLSWLQVHYADIVCARAHSSNLQQREYQQRLQDRAQRRYLSAIRSLATVRRLLLPTAVQVNIGGQHVNMLDTGAQP